VSKRKPVRKPIRKSFAWEEVKETELEEVVRRLGWTEEVAALQARFVRGVLNQR